MSELVLSPEELLDEDESELDDDGEEEDGDLRLFLVLFFFDLLFSGLSSFLLFFLLLFLSFDFFLLRPCEDVASWDPVVRALGAP